MSLKYFHILFIVLSILMTAGFAFWAFNYSKDPQNRGYALVGGGAMLVAVALVIYGYNFLKKMKNIK